MGWVFGASPEIDAQSRYPVILGVCISLTLLMVATVCLRLFVRIKLGRFDASDYVMVFGMIFSIIYNALCIAPRPPHVHKGTTRPLTVDELLNYAGRPFYQLGIAGFKAALCINYLHLLAKTSKRFYRMLVWGVILLTTLGHVAGTLVLILNCKPIERAWNQTIPGKCLPVGPTFYGLAAFTIISDVSVIFLPIPLLLQLNVKPAQKAGVVCLFLLGLFTTICSILRLTQINRVVAIDGDSTMLVLWGTIEFNVGVSWTSSAKIERGLTDVQNIVTSLPFLTPLLKVWVRDFQSRSGGEHRKNTGYTLQSYSKNRRSQLRSENSKEPVLAQRTPSEELILDADDSSARANAEIHVTVEYRVSHENHK
ncbi:integral membrane protein [Aspergillus fumigatus]|nr:integral membrane protein [Aspergillus fumigatus]